jgi:hypothetical protein
VEGRVREQSLELDDSKTSDIRLAIADAIDKDTPKDDFELLYSIPAQRWDIEVVFQATSSEVKEEKR